MSNDFEPTQTDPKTALYAKFIAFFADIPGTTDRFGNHDKFFAPTEEQSNRLRNSTAINALGFYNFTAAYTSSVAWVESESGKVHPGKESILFTVIGEVNIDFFLDYDPVSGEVSFEKDFSAIQDGLVCLDPILAKFALGNISLEEIDNYRQNIALEKSSGVQDPTPQEIEAISEILDSHLESSRP